MINLLKHFKFEFYYKQTNMQPILRVKQPVIQLLTRYTTSNT